MEPLMGMGTYPKKRASSTFSSSLKVKCLNSDEQLNNLKSSIKLDS